MLKKYIIYEHDALNVYFYIPNSLIMWLSTWCLPTASPSS